MASRNIEDLSYECQKKANQIYNYCRDSQVDLLIYCTLRSLDEQAILFRQSRTFEEIERKVNQYYENGYEYLAEVILRVGPQNGPHVTNAGPGESWHNYAEAFDAVPLYNGKALWSYIDHKKEWNIYGKAIVNSGMSWAGNWITFKEYPHAQLHDGGNPLNYYSPNEVYDILLNLNLI